MLPEELLLVLLLEPPPKRDPRPLRIPEEPDPELPLEFELLLELVPCCVSVPNPKPNPTLPEALPEFEPLSNLPFRKPPNPGMLPAPELELEFFLELLADFAFDPAPAPVASL